MRERLESADTKNKDELNDYIKQEVDKFEKDMKKQSEESFDVTLKVQQSLRILSEYIFLVIDATDVRKKIEKLSYDTSLEDMKSINLGS